MARQWSGESWSGGRIAVSSRKKGGKIWVLERSFEGRQYSFALKTRDEAGALADLSAWNLDPSRFISDRRQAKAQRKAQAWGHLHMTEALLDALQADMQRRELSAEHVRRSRAYLEAWRDDLGARADLRLVTRQQVQAALALHGTARRHRIVAWKVLGAFLVDSGRLDQAQSPGRHVDVPTALPARLVASRGYGAEVLAACYARLPSQPHRDVFRLQALYGMHGSEVQRLARGEGQLERLPDGPIAGVITFRHKSGRIHSISLDARAWAAACRLAATGGAPGRWQMLKACRRHGVHPAQLRHSFVQLGQGGHWVYPTGRGVSVEELTHVTGHHSSGTTRKHYDGGVPRMIVIPLELSHPGE